MDIDNFVKKFNNYPVLFIGTGISLRYLETSFSWEGLLRSIVLAYSDNEYFLDLKSKCFNPDGTYDLSYLASIIESDFEEFASNKENRNGKFKGINDSFYQILDERNKIVSRMKLFICDLLQPLDLKTSMIPELNLLKKAKKNVASIITTNYDQFIETQLGFNPLVGNDILLSNPYGTVYKIHGCRSDPSSLIITSQDYKYFEERYELIRAQLLSIFVHNPIIFLGYGISDENIKKLLRTIFSYVKYDSEESQKIRDNFLLVEYDKHISNDEVIEHDIDLGNGLIVRINKIKTCDYSKLYEAIAALKLKVSVMDIRRVQDHIKDITAGEGVEVTVVEDIDSLDNADKILMLGPKAVIQFVPLKSSAYITDYFQILSSQKDSRINLIDKCLIYSAQWFPIFGFIHTYPELEDHSYRIQSLKSQQIGKLESFLSKNKKSKGSFYSTVNSLVTDKSISKSRVSVELVYAILEDRIPLSSVEEYLKEQSIEINTEYKKILCAYDFQKYSKDKGVLRIPQVKR